MSRCFRLGIHHKAELRFPSKARLCIELQSMAVTSKSVLLILFCVPFFTEGCLIMYSDRRVGSCPGNKLLPGNC